MNRNRITNLLLAVFILAGLIICGVIGYRNDSGRVSPNQTPPAEAFPTETPANIELVYCYSPAVSLCVVSFGSDNAGNLLIVIRNNLPGLEEFYAKIDQTGTGTEPKIETETETPIPTPIPTPEPYTCQKVEFTRDVYYCTGSLIADGTMVTLEVYSKADDRLVASGSILVSVGATPEPNATVEPTATREPLEPTATLPPPTEQISAPTPTDTATVSPTATATQTSSVYPYLYP